MNLQSIYKPYPAYKSSGIEWISKIPCDWSIERIKNIISKEQTGIWGEEAQGDENDVICIRVADFDYYSCGIMESNSYTIRNILKKDLEKRILRPHVSLLIEKSGGGDLQPVGRIVLFNKDFKVISSNFITNFSTLTICDTRFFLYLTRTLYQLCINIKSIKQTTGIQNLDTKSFFKEFIPLPSLSEQITIAFFLDQETTRINNIIEKERRLIELLKEKRSALITHAVTKGLDPNVPMKPSGVAWIGEVPERWNEIRIRFIAKINPSKSELKNDHKNVEVSFVPMEDVPDYDDYLSLSKTANIEDVKNGYTYFRNDDIVIAKITPCFENSKGAIAKDLVNGIAFGTTELHVFRMTKNISPEFFFLFSKLEGVRKFGEALMKGAAGQKRVPELYFKDFRLAHPSIKEQLEIINFVNKEKHKIVDLIDKIKLKIQLLEEYKQSLINASVTGKIDIRNHGTTNS